MIIEKRVSSGSDDVEENASGALYVNSTDLELVTDGANVQTVGLRFSGVNIPQGAVVTQAYLQFKTDEVSTGPAALSIRGEDADDSAGFSGTSSVSSRPQTSASVPWTPPDWTVTGAAGAAQRTPDLASVVQEIVARPGWQALNDMTFTITGSGRRTAESFEGDAAGAPLLHVEYSVPDEWAGVRLAAFGDWSDGPGTQAVANLVDAMDVDFIITTGDNTYDPVESIDSQVGRIYGDYIGNYSGAYGPGSASNRFFPSLGNHDYSEHGLNAYLNYFTLPGNERYYDFEAGPVHFFAINSNPQEPAGTSSSSVQARWLRDGLANSDAPHKIVYFHHPPYSSSTVHGSELGMRWPFEEWGATAVFSGHDHAYERVMRDDNGDGVLLPYFTTGLGGHSRYSFGTPVSGSAVRYSADYGTMIIDASDTQIDFEFWSVAGGGRLIDSYGIAPTVGGDDSDVVYRWNAGTTTVAAIDGGKAWTADSSAIVGGPTNVFAGGITSLHSSVPKASVPVGIFAQERWDPPTGAEMGLEFGKGGLAAGIFAVRLFIGNGYQGTNAVGDRVFDVLVEGKTAFNDVDPVARFGQKAGGMLEWRGAITDGTIDIDFRHGVQNPLINGVEIAYLGDDAVPPEPPETGVVYRWNAGTATVAAIDGGKAWTADGSAIVGGPTNVFAGGITTLHSSVPKTSVPVGIFAQERWDPPTGAEMGLEFGKGGLAAGSYAVRLFIGNGYQGTDAVGDRVFDALVEGKTAFDDVDPVALFGQKAGGMLEWRGEVTDGTIDIDFRRGVENPLINGVEIAYLGDDLLL